MGLQKLWRGVMLRRRTFLGMISTTCGFGGSLSQAVPQQKGSFPLDYMMYMCIYTQARRARAHTHTHTFGKKYRRSRRSPPRTHVLLMYGIQWILSGSTCAQLLQGERRRRGEGGEKRREGRERGVK